MNDRTSTPRQNDPHAHSTAEIDDGMQWLNGQDGWPWASRVRVDDTSVQVRTEGMPPVIRYMLFERLNELEAMTSNQVREYLTGPWADRAALVATALGGALR